MKERIEDLGRIREILDHQVLDSSLFDEAARPRRPKHVIEWMGQYTDDQLVEVLETLFCNIEEVESALHRCYSIAAGTEED